MKTNVLRVLPPSLFCCSLCAIVTGRPQFFAERSGEADYRKSGGVEIAGNVCNYVICNKVW